MLIWLTHLIQLHSYYSHGNHKNLNLRSEDTVTKASIISHSTPGSSKATVRTPTISKATKRALRTSIATSLEGSTGSKPSRSMSYTWRFSHTRSQTGHTWSWWRPAVTSNNRSAATQHYWRGKDIVKEHVPIPYLNWWICLSSI